MIGSIFALAELCHLAKALIEDFFYLQLKLEAIQNLIINKILFWKWISSFYVLREG